jgi:alpha-glucosidase (family GH31 glycosyl hydrolase)
VRKLKTERLTPLLRWLSPSLAALWLIGCSAVKQNSWSGISTLPVKSSIATGIDGYFYETSAGRQYLPTLNPTQASDGSISAKVTMPDGRIVSFSLKPEGGNFEVSLTAEPDSGIVKWGLALDASENEYFTGLMERVVDGPQTASWEPGLTNALNLHGQKVDMILKPTTSVYAPFYISSRNYAVSVKGNWPGFFDFCASDPQRVKIEFEGPSFHMKIYTAATPAGLVKAHALDAGPPFLPPKWMYQPWRWRDENRERDKYYDGTAVTGPFNSEFMEDVLLMKAYGISNGIYWFDRPWGRGPNGCDDFEIDSNRFPHFAESVKWLEGQGMHTVIWIAPFFQGEMYTNAFAKNYTLAGQQGRWGDNNYPMVDLTNPDAKKYWQDGVAKFLKMGVAGFKLDRAEEDIPESGPYKVFDGRSIRENRNAYPPMYAKAVYDVAEKYRKDNDFVVMPRSAYAGSSPYAVFWGGDIGGTEYGLRAEIIGVQRASVMGYPNWGSDTGGYTSQSMDTEVVGRWLGFSCFTPIMEVGPTRNVGFWNYHSPARYDADLIAIWRFYARLHARLADYSFAQGKIANQTGMPIVRSLFLVEPNAPAAWSNWWTYLYGADILVSPIWQRNQRTQTVYLPTGEKWRDAWTGKVYTGGQTITVDAELHQLPMFVRVGAKVDLGDLQKEWTDSVAIANTRPDLKALDAEVRSWFERQYPGGGATAK